MQGMARFSAFLSLSMVCICACQAGTQAPASLTTINAAQGGKIVYGAVAGATTQPAALVKLLSMVHANCGEKPQIGKAFQFTGTNSVGVFFTVTDHPEGNIPLAGLVIATATGPNQVQAALLYDRAAQFGTTVNPMLQQLSSVWHPGAAPAAFGSANATTPSPSSANGGGAFAPAAALQRFTLPDKTASVGIPAGWQVVSGSGGGTIALTGPHGDYANLDMGITALDTTNPMEQQLQRSGAENAYRGKWVFYPSKVELTKAFTDIYQKIRAIAGEAGSANLQIAKATSISASQGKRCVEVNGQMNPNGQGAEELNAVMCLSTPSPGGEYGITLSTTVLPVAYAAQDRATAAAILASLQVNEELLKQQAAAAAAPGIAAINRNAEAQAAQDISVIHQIGANTTARINASEAANSAQQANWQAGQNANAQNAAGFSNYLLDQSVIQNNSTGAHATAWNSTADALVQSNPNKYSYVSTPNYIPGTDY